MKLRILNSKEVKKIMACIEEQFGFTKKLDCAFLMNRKSRIYIVSKDISDIDLDSLRIDTLGLYFATMYDDGIRLSIEGSQLVGPHASKNILKLEGIELRDYIKGEDLAGKDISGYYLVSNGKDFFGCAKLTPQKILNFVSKARRLRVINE